MSRYVFVKLADRWLIRDVDNWVAPRDVTPDLLESIFPIVKEFKNRSSVEVRFHQRLNELCWTDTSTVFEIAITVKSGEIVKVTAQETTIKHEPIEVCKFYFDHNSSLI